MRVGQCAVTSELTLLSKSSGVLGDFWMCEKGTNLRLKS